MERLTERDEFGNADIIGVDSEELQCNLTFDEFNRVTNELNRLAQYEDVHENIIKKMKELKLEHCRLITEMGVKPQQQGGKCDGFQKSANDDEPCNTCMECKLNTFYEE